ncbi:MAG: mechanosensitive ion channel family protein [Chthoniobacteraceae bacterium]
MQLIPKVLILATLLACATAPAQTPTAATPAPAESVTPSPTPQIDYTAQIVAAENERGKIEADLNAAPPVSALAEATAAKSHELLTAYTATAQALAAKPSLNTVRELETRWQEHKEALSALKNGLTRRSDAYRNQAAALDRIKKSVDDDWSKLLSDGTPPTLPADWKKRLADLKTSTVRNRETVQKQLSTLTSPLAAVHEQEPKLAATLKAVNDAETPAAARLFLSESVPVWRIPIWSESKRTGTGLNFAQEARAAWDKQCAALVTYIQAQSDRLLLHATGFAVLLAGLWWAHRRVSAWADDEPSLKQAAIVFEVPTSMALAFSLVVFPLVYPQPPQLLSAIIGAASLIPAILILRRLIDRHLFPVLNLLVVFYFVDQLRTVASGFPIAARLLFLLEMATGCGLLGWMLWSNRRAPEGQAPAAQVRTPIVAVKLELTAFAAALLANAIGCVDLGNLVGNAALGSAYVAVILYAATRIIDGVVIGALSMEPLSTLGAVRHHRSLIWRRTHLCVKAAAVVLWALGTLELLAVSSKALGALKACFWKGTDLTVVGQVLVFGLVVWAAFLLSRFIRFVLEEDFYPRMKMERGLSYAVSTVLHYTVLLVGFSVAASKVGVDMTKFTILVSAFGVGMGFGLQNIINNFVSGVILLFERPVKVGDVVQLDADTSGVVDRIGIRASVIRTGSGSEIILPNGKLISEQVINWTLSNRRRSLDLTVSVAYGTEPCRVMELLKKIATEHPLISKAPAPNALLSHLKADSLEFKLTAWTDRIEACGQIHSDLAVAILAAFEKEGIHRPSPAAAVPVTA